MRSWTQCSIPAFLLSAAVALQGCAPTGGLSQSASRDQAGASPDRPLVLIARGEPDTIGQKAVLRATGLSFNTVPRLFNAGLAILDVHETPHAYLVKDLPQLNTDTWKVFPDGRMETTYRLHPNLTWHDGIPLDAHDFVFAWRVYTTPEFGQSSSPPLSEISEVAAPDQRTVVIRWKSLYPQADQLKGSDLPSIPSHLLEGSFRDQPPENFAHLSFWTQDYVGLGPYRLTHWEPGAFLQGAAFDGHVWGKPKIPRVRVLFISDFNTALATMLAGQADITVDDGIRFEQGAILRKEWAANNGGTVITSPDQWRRTEIQHRPDFANPRAVLDLRVRRALAYAVDKQSLNEGLFEGDAIITDSFIPPGVAYYAAVAGAIGKYPTDLRRSEQLMAEAGWTKGSDGIYVHPADGRFSGELKVNASTQAAQEMAIMADGWRRAGFEFQQTPVPEAQSRIGEVRGGFPTLYTGGGSVGEAALTNFVSSNIPRPENNWVGSNRGGWVNSDYDRLFQAFNTTLDRPVRDQQVVDMVQAFTDQVAAISLFFNPGIVAHISALQGPGPYVPGGDRAWDIHSWSWK